MLTSNYFSKFQSGHNCGSICFVLLGSYVHAAPVQWSVEERWKWPLVPGCRDLFECCWGTTWLEAEAYARQYGTHLVTITSAGENHFVFNLVNDIKYGFGLNRLAVI